MVPERAVRQLSRLTSAPTRLQAIGTEISTSPAAAAAAITRLSDLLHNVYAARNLLSCTSFKHTETKNAAVAIGKLDLDGLHATIWRLHARARKQMPSASATQTLANKRAIRLLPLGDSITDGGAKQRSYRYHLHRLLELHGQHVQWLGTMAGVFDKSVGRNASRGALLRGRAHADWPVWAQVHEGHWGWTSKQVLHGHERQPQRGALAAWLAQSRVQVGSSAAASAREAAKAVGGGPPDVTLVHLGTNDLTKLVLKDGGKGPRERVQATARRVHTIVSALCRTNPRMQILVAAPIPFCRFGTGSEAQLRERRQRRRAAEAAYVAKLCAPGQLAKAATPCSGGKGAARKEFERQQQQQVVCVNMSSVVGCEDLVADGVHPAAAGAKKMAKQWMISLEPRLRTMALEHPTASTPAARPSPDESPDESPEVGRGTAVASTAAAQHAHAPGKKRRRRRKGAESENASTGKSAAAAPAWLKELES